MERLSALKATLHYEELEREDIAMVNLEMSMTRRRVRQGRETTMQATMPVRVEVLETGTAETVIGGRGLKLSASRSKHS